MGNGARILLAVLVAGTLALAWWMTSSPPGPGGAALPGAASPTPARPAAARPEPVEPAAVSPLAGAAPRSGASLPIGDDTPAAIEVIVLDELERPLPGARVHTFEDSQEGSWITDEHGRVELPFTLGSLDLASEVGEGRGAGDRVRLVADKPGYFHVDRTPRLRPQVFLTLRRAIPLGGLVTDRDGGGPVSGATLGFRHRECTDCEPETAVSSGTGRYAFEAIPIGSKLDLMVEAEGYVKSRSSFRADPDTTAAEHDVVLGRGLHMSVIVLDAETRVPIEGAQVRGAKERLATDAVGMVASDQLVAVDDPRPRLWITAPGYCLLAIRPTLGELAAAPELIAPLVRTVTLEGRAVDDRGLPVSAVELTWPAGFEWTAKTADQTLAVLLADLPKWSLGSDPDGTDGSFSSGADGRFTLRGAVPWTPDFELTAQTSDGRSGTAVLTLPGPGGGARVAVELRSAPAAEGGATIRGRFTLNGEPEKGHINWRGTTESGSARPDKRGDFVLTGVEPGPVELLVRSDQLIARSSCALVDMGPVLVNVAPGEELQYDLPIELPLSTIEGRVTYTTGAPVEAARVEAKDPERCWRERVQTDSEGRFELTVPTGLFSFEVEVEHSPERLSRRDVAPGSLGVDFVLAEHGRLRFRALDESDGSAITKARIDWRRAGTPFRELADFGDLVPDPEGWYEVDCVAGVLDFSISTGRDRHVPRQLRGVAVHAGQTTEIELLLNPSLARRVVLDERSIPLPDGFAAVLVPEGIWNRIRYSPEPKPGWKGLGKSGPFDELHFKQNGTARARGLKPGKYRFKVWPETVRITPERVRLGADEPEGTLSVHLDWR